MNDRKKNERAYFVVFFAAILMLVSTIPSCMATPPVSGKLWLDTIPPGTYVGVDEDAWITESTVTTSTSYDLEIYYHHGDDIHFLYLLVAVDRDPAGNVTVNVSGSTVGPYDGVITGNNNALVDETEPVYEYPGHGIYKNGSSTHFEVVNITDMIPGGTLVANETVIVPIEINPINPVKVHFDAVGAKSDKMAIAFVPPSHDVTSDIIPEFTTIAIPIAAILGLLFFFNHRKKRGE